MIKIIGYNKEIEVQQDDGFGSEEMEQFYIFGKCTNTGKCFEYKLINEFGSCSSGYCSATWGSLETKEIDKIGTIQHKPIKDLYVEEINEIIVVDENGGCGRYPSGSAYIKKDALKLFKKTGRQKEKRQVYIFSGNSGLGKSYIAHLTGKPVFETDTVTYLPNEITENIIVVGNKYDYTVEDVKECIKGEFEIIDVKFTI